VAGQRGIEIIESRSSRPRDFANLLSVKLHTTEGERWLEGTVFEPDSPRLMLVDGVNVEAPLEGTLIILCNDDQPGVIGEVGTILGRHRVNIASFALGRSKGGAVGVVNVDAKPEDEALSRSLEELRAVKAIREVKIADVRSAGL
jgi:D-3-phosphoglycerate dehydrogenase